MAIAKGIIKKGRKETRHYVSSAKQRNNKMAEQKQSTKSAWDDDDVNVTREDKAGDTDVSKEKDEVIDRLAAIVDRVNLGDILAELDRRLRDAANMRDIIERDIRSEMKNKDDAEVEKKTEAELKKWLESEKKKREEAAAKAKKEAEDKVKEAADRDKAVALKDSAKKEEVKK